MTKRNLFFGLFIFMLISACSAEGEAQITPTTTSLYGITYCKALGVDLRMAGLWGEDSNHDGVFQEREDLNGNGVLDADWSLPDGETQNVLAFNGVAIDRKFKTLIF